MFQKTHGHRLVEGGHVVEEAFHITQIPGQSLHRLKSQSDEEIFRTENFLGLNQNSQIDSDR